jgi:hypothetical protein
MIKPLPVNFLCQAQCRHGLNAERKVKTFHGQIQGLQLIKLTQVIRTPSYPCAQTYRHESEQYQAVGGVILLR